MGRGSCGGTSPLPEGKNWLPHTGRRQAMRGLRQNWKATEKEAKTDEDLRVAIDRLLETVISVVNDHEEELATMLVAMGARVRASETGMEYSRALERACDELDAQPRVAESWNAPPAS